MEVHFSKRKGCKVQSSFNDFFFWGFFFVPQKFCVSHFRHKSLFIAYQPPDAVILLHLYILTSSTDVFLTRSEGIYM